MENSPSRPQSARGMVKEEKEERLPFKIVISIVACISRWSDSQIVRNSSSCTLVIRPKADCFLAQFCRCHDSCQADLCVCGTLNSSGMV